MRKAVLISLAFAATPVVAQEQASYQMPIEYKEVQARQLETQRRLFIAMADSMPVRLYRDKVTPIQRDFANQVYHAVSGALGIAGRFAASTQPSIQADTAQVLNSEAAMIAYINEVYDWAVAQLNAQSPAARREVIGFFGQQIPRWQVWDEINQHSLWTAGQIVANFRKHGMAPPGFGFF
jgi:hypothetical protein